MEGRRVVGQPLNVTAIAQRILRLTLPWRADVSSANHSTTITAIVQRILRLTLPWRADVSSANHSAISLTVRP